MDYIRLYDILYALTAKDGREAKLFGACAPAAREAFARSLAGKEFPELWFEFPFAGEPWLDFHALTSYGSVAGTQATFAGHGGIYADALAWFANQEPHKVRQLALSYDTSAGDVDNPAVQLLVGGYGTAVPLAFLEAAGRPDLREPFDTFIRRIPDGWYACYVGVFPGRDAASSNPWVRMECIIGDEWQRVYANDAAVLRQHLLDLGLEHLDDKAIDGIQMLARSPFPLEFQFNVGLDGRALPVLSASVRFQPTDWQSITSLGTIGRLAGWLQSCGLADERCKLLTQMAFATSVTREDESHLVSCFPAFVKLRWREGLPPDAKAYLLAMVD